MRLTNLNNNMSNQKTGIEVTLEYIKRDIAEIKEKLDSSYVTAEAFEPVKKIVYGLVAVVLTSGLGLLISVVIK